MSQAIIPPDVLAKVSAHLRITPKAEVEVRFGDFSGHKFKPGVSRQVFSRLRDWAVETFKFGYTHSVDRFDDKVRQTTIMDEAGEALETFAITKTRLDNVDIPNHFIRLSISQESPADLPDPFNPTMTRDKRRWSFDLDKAYRLDLTETSTTENGFSQTFEVEIELTGGELDLPTLPNLIRRFMTHYLQSPLLYTASERRDVMSALNRSLGGDSTKRELDMSRLMQARNLKMRDMTTGGLIPSSESGVNYTVTIKADGVRMLMLMMRRGVYLISSPNQVMKILGEKVAKQLDETGGTVIEGEYIPRANISKSAPTDYHKLDLLFLMYDTLSLSGDSDVQYRDHSVRMESVERFARAMTPLAYNNKKLRRHPMLFLTKQFVPFTTASEFYAATSNVLNIDHPFLDDGLMLTPANHRYDPSVSLLPLKDRRLPSAPDLLKWKPKDQLTIDLEWRDNQLLSFMSERWPRKRKIGIDPVYKHQPNAPPKRLFFVGSRDTPFDLSMLTMNNVLEKAPDGSIVEFHWRDNGLSATRVRTDKAVPNAIDVAVDVWNDIFKPIDYGVVTGTTFGLSFRYHNREKWEMFNYLGRVLKNKETKSLLSVGAGRGGDIYKWVRNEFTHVVCVEPDEDNRIELKRRLIDSGLKYRIVSAQGQDVDAIANAVHQFTPDGNVDVVGYMLSLSFFFGDEESEASIGELTERVLAKNGYFAAFTLNGASVNKFFENNKLAKTRNGVKKARFKQIEFELRPPSEKVATQHLFVNIPDSIVNNQIEFPPDLISLDEMMTRQGLELLVQENATKEKFMTREESLYSSLFTSLIYRKFKEQTVHLTFKEVETMLQKGLVVDFDVAARQGVMKGNTRIELTNDAGKVFNAVVRYNEEENEILAPLIQFDTAAELIDSGVIIGTEIEEDTDPTIMILMEQGGNKHAVKVQYDEETGEISPPE